MGVIGRLLGSACRQAWQSHTSSAVPQAVACTLPAVLQSLLQAPSWSNSSSSCSSRCRLGPSSSVRHYASQFSEVTDPKLIRDFAIIGKAMIVQDNPTPSALQTIIGLLRYLRAVAHSIVNCKRTGNPAPSCIPHPTLTFPSPH